MTQHTALEPVRKQLSVGCDVETAFRTFTEDMATWWPVATHSITGDPETVVFEQDAGGRVYERAKDGKERDWATILVYEPPSRVVLEWKVNAAAPPTEVEVRFSPDGERTHVELEHRGWERYPSGGAEERSSYDSGWPGVLERYKEATA
ncbi:MAG TPA: SRPBCC family protein [Gaiellaceae bacterium]|nr:SRPBCC family protein [Gaiellaceae bacterium]